MTEIDVSEYDDLRGDQVLTSRQKDRVLDELAGESDAVVFLEDWLASEKSLFPIAGVDQLFAGEKIVETEKAFLFNTTEEDDPDDAIDGVEWVPKSCSRLYLAADDDVDDRTPANSLDEF